MTKPTKLYANLLADPARVIAFRDLERLLLAFGFEHRRTSGSHRSYRHASVPEVLTVQPRGKDAQPYQVRKLLTMIRAYGLELGE